MCCLPQFWREDNLRVGTPEDEPNLVDSMFRPSLIYEYTVPRTENCLQLQIYT